MRNGIVKFFDSRSEKRFGFILRDGEQDLFFHFNDGVFPEIDPYTHEVSLNEKNVLSGKHLPDPKKGDELVFYTNSSGWRGEKASPWTFKKNYDEAVLAAKNMPEPTSYRVLESINRLDEPQGKPTILWEGIDLRDLIKRFPRTGRASTDPLIPYWGDNDNIFETRHWFEKKVGDGFVECDDPRSSAM